MEEYIELLEEFKDKGYSMLYMKFDGDRNTTNLRIKTAIENLIKGYRELEEENNKFRNGEIVTGKLMAVTKKHLFNDLKNYIPKSKVKEKIEELKIDRNAIKKEIEEAKKEKNKEYYADLLRHLQVNYGEKKALSELMEDK